MTSADHGERVGILEENCSTLNRADMNLSTIIVEALCAMTLELTNLPSCNVPRIKMVQRSHLQLSKHTEQVVKMVGLVGAELLLMLVEEVVTL